MKKNNTKQKIMLEALSLFSVHGFAGVSIKEIAAAVGIKDSSIYKHYKSKQAIYEAILSEVSERIQTAYEKIGMPKNESLVETYASIAEKDLEQLCIHLFSFYLQDDVLCKFRRMLTIEQYQSKEAGSLFHRFFIDDVLHFEENLFKKLIRQGIFRDSDPAVMALHFYSPLFLLLYKYDNSLYEKEELTMQIKKHISAFSKAYVKDEKEE